MKISKKSIFIITLILWCSMIWLFTLSQPVHAAQKNTMTVNNNTINIYVKMAKDQEGKLKIRKGISGDTLSVNWKRHEDDVFCKKTHWFEAQIKHPDYPQYLVKRNLIGKKGKGLCSFTNTISYNHLELSALYFFVKDGNNFSTNKDKIEDNLYNYFWNVYSTKGGGTFGKKFTAIGKIWFYENIRTVFGSSSGTDKTIQFDVQYHFIIL